MKESYYPARAVIDLAALSQNLQLLQGKAPTQTLLAVVKADAYGHQLGPVALAAVKAGVTWLGTAQLDEALHLRAALDDAGVPRPADGGPRILTWIIPPGDSTVPALKAAFEADLDISASNIDMVQAAASAQQACGRQGRVHLKVDTGMSRAGANASDWPALLEAALQVGQPLAWDGANPSRIADTGDQLALVGIWSHLARGDDLSVQGRAATALQVREFCTAVQVAQAKGWSRPLRHLGASSAILWHPEAHFDLVRAGIAMYGLSPDPNCEGTLALGLNPVMRLEAQLTGVKKLAKGRAVSYGGTWRAREDRWLGLVPLGYADGISRHCSNRANVWVAGRLCPIVGRICMDQFVIDLGPVYEETGGELPPLVRVGEQVILFGNPGRKGLELVPLADDWADLGGTINYEVLTRLGPRVPRVFAG